jgi:hypothetical protein
MLTTLLCVAAVLGTAFGFGVPLTWLLRGRRPLRPSAWLEAPFFGLCGLILALQNLVYLDVPLARSAPWAWLAAAALWACMARAGHLRASLRSCPRGVLVVALALYLVHGLGMLKAGVAAYGGRAWTDQANYVAQTEALVRAPLHASAAAFDHQPFLLSGARFTRDRIGQAVLLGFLAVTLRRGARPLFEPTILLAPLLVFLAVHALAARLGVGRRRRLLAAAVAAALPALTLLHLESFLSHALAVPLLLFFAATAHDLAKRPDWRALARAALLSSGTAAVYPEFWPLLAGTATVVLGVTARPPRRAGVLLGCWAAVLGAPALFNLGFVTTGGLALSRFQVTSLNHIYPWSFRVEGVVRLWLGNLGARALGRPAGWFGDVAPALPGPAGVLVRGLSLAATGLGLLGLLRACQASWPAGERNSGPRGRARFGLAAGLLALALLPLATLAWDEGHAYQFYKLVLTSAPLLGLGLTLLSGASRTRWGEWRAGVPLAAVAAAAMVATAGMVLRPARAAAPRSMAPYVLAPEFLQVQEQLERLAGEDVLL